MRPAAEVSTSVVCKDGYFFSTLFSMHSTSPSLSCATTRRSPFVCPHTENTEKISLSKYISDMIPLRHHVSLIYSSMF